MSVFARDNLFDFDKFAYGSAASTLLFLIIALLTISFIWATRMNVEADER
jgi:trehalose/maltose transport system permease protein